MATRRPGLTKTQALRQARSTALVKQFAERKETVEQPEPPKRRRIAPTHEPKKVDFTKPGLTKAMLARKKHAEEMKKEYARKKEEETAPATRRPRRTPAPIGGDARVGRERMPKRDAPERRKPPPKALPPIPEKTRELAKTIRADVVRAEPIGTGPIDSVVIPAGSIKDNRTTIVSIPQPPEASRVADRSMQVISETLDDQDAAEAVAVQSKLDDLQQARRDFVMTVANISGKVAAIDQVPPIEAETPPRYLQRVHDIDDPYLRIEYTKDHPIVEAAREFMQKSLRAMRESEAAKKWDDEIKKITQVATEIALDLDDEPPLYEEKLVDVDEDEEYRAPPTPPGYRGRQVVELSPSAHRRDVYEYAAFDPEELERFFDIERYPPFRIPPFGREALHPDLWDIEDPWFIPPPEPDQPDLIQFD
ncbi:serine/arginine repetitive matrix protein 1 [Vespula squamosa]|uniref:Serine/arginine repetitive matrix protein 1 n=1 Tax=Vespula squamosa TaxID=30214 RepID=A0ABD2BDZ4_VESSQ